MKLFYDKKFYCILFSCILLSTLFPSNMAKNTCEEIGRNEDIPENPVITVWNFYGFRYNKNIVKLSREEAFRIKQEMEGVKNIDDRWTILQKNGIPLDKQHIGLSLEKIFPKIHKKSITDDIGRYESINYFCTVNAIFECECIDIPFVAIPPFYFLIAVNSFGYSKISSVGLNGYQNVENHNGLFFTTAMFFGSFLMIPFLDPDGGICKGFAYMVRVSY